MLWPEAVAQYETRYGELHHAPETRAKVRRVLQLFRAEARVGDLEQIERRHVEAYQLARKNEGMSPATINQHVRHLKAFLEWCVGEEWIPKNPCRRVKMLKQIRRKGDTPSEEQIEKFLGWLRRKKQTFYLDLIKLIANTGLRSGEALHLRPEDVDLKRRLLWTMCRAEYVTKDREERCIPLNDEAAEILRRRILKARGGPLFVGTYGTGKGKIPKVESVAHRIKALASAAGVPGIKCYSLRKFFGTMNAARMPELALAAIMGHEQIETTRKHYVEQARMKLDVRPASIG